MASKVSFVKVLSKLMSQTKPVSLYQYQIPPLVKYGSLTLSLVLVTYGTTFIGWTWDPSVAIYKQKVSALEWQQTNALEKCKFYAKTFGPIALTLVPFSGAIISMFLRSRIVTDLTFIPRVNRPPQCQLTRSSIILGRSLTKTVPVHSIVRNEIKRVYTGIGSQGVDDNSSYIFYMKDINGNWLTKLYIFARSGKFWSGDGRIFDALFGKESVKDLEHFTPETKGKSSPKYLQNNLVSEVDKEVQSIYAKSKLHSGVNTSSMARDIVKRAQLNKSKNS